MALVEETLNKAVRDVVNVITGISEFAIRAKQNAPRPTIAYCSVDTVTITRVGWEERALTDRIEDDVDSRLEGYREVMFSLNFYRDNAYDKAMLVRIALMRNNTLEILRSANLGLGRRSEIRDISEPLENGWEERAQFDFILSAIGTDDEIITSIAVINIAGDFQTRGTSIPITVGV